MARKPTPTPTPAGETPAGETPAVETPAVETPAAPAVVAAPAAAESALLKAYAALGKVETAADKVVRAARAEQLPATLDAWQAFGMALKPIVAAGSFDWDDCSGTGLFRAIGKGLLSEAGRALLPNNATAYSKGLTIARHDTASRRSAFLKAGNLPDSDEYVVWLTLTATGKAGSNRSTIDLQASLLKPADWDDTANDGKGAPKPGAAIGKLVRSAAGRGAGAGGSDNPVPAAIGKVLKLRGKRDKLAAVPTVVTLNIPADKWDAFVGQVIAQYLLQHVETPAGETPIVVSIPA